MTERFVDEFQAELAQCDLPLPASLEICGIFGDLLWPPAPDFAFLLSDPAFTLTGYSRGMALARIHGDIRFFAGPLPEGGFPWWWSGENPARRAAVEAEPWACELGILETVGDAVSFAIRYLSGTDLGRIEIVRVPPRRESRRP